MGMRSSVSAAAMLAPAGNPGPACLLDSFSEALICDGESRVRFLNLAAERVNRLSRRRPWACRCRLFPALGAEFDDFQQAVRRGGKSALTRSRDGRVFLSSSQRCPPAPTRSLTAC
jgi:hypothetical protein